MIANSDLVAELEEVDFACDTLVFEDAVSALEQAVKVAKNKMPANVIFFMFSSCSKISTAERIVLKKLHEKSIENHKFDSRRFARRAFETFARENSAHAARYAPYRADEFRHKPDEENEENQ